MKALILLATACIYFCNSINAADITKGYTWQLVNKGELLVSQSEGEKDQTFPSVIEIPQWVAKPNRAHPNAKYYFYYGEHHGKVIKMKWAEHITGPWTPYNQSNTRQGVMNFEQDSDRNSGDNAWRHLASPTVILDEARQRFVVSFHGKIAKKLTAGGETAEAIHGNFIAFSPYGLNFNDPVSGGGIKGYGPLEVSHGGIARAAYMTKPYPRFFRKNGELYAMGRKGLLQKPKSQQQPWKTRKSKPFHHLWESQTQANTLFKNEVKAKSPKYHSAIATWFASREFAAHANNPHPGKIITSKGKFDRVNHIGLFQRSNSSIEVFFWVRGDTKKIFGIDDPYNSLYRVVLDIGADSWNNWDVKRDDNGQVIFDVVVDPTEVYEAVKQANGGGDINGLTHADPTSMGVPYLIETMNKLYCFVAFHSEDMGGADSEGQIMLLELVAK